METRKDSKQSSEKPGFSKIPKPSLRPNKGNIFKGIFIYAIIAILTLFIFYNLYGFSTSRLEEKSLTTIAEEVKEGRIEKIIVEGEKLNVSYKDGGDSVAYKESEESLSSTLKNLGADLSEVEIQVAEQDSSSFWLNLIFQALPLLLMIAFFVFMFRQAQSAGSSLFSFGKSRAKLFSKNMPQVKFSDAAGVTEAKEELQEVIQFLKQPQKFRALGAKVPRGVLLVGPPGTGKTLLARAVAGEAGVPFYSIAGSEFMEMLVGVGASRVRDLFEEAKKNAPAIVFIDELDAIGRQRGAGLGGGHDEREQTLNQILVEMDGFDPNVNVIVVAATNRPDILDPALLRPGRFDRRIVLDLPDIKGRKGIIKIHAKGKPIAKSVNFDKLARRTVGFSGADLENMLNEAAILAARQNKKEISAKDLEEAATKVKLGPEKKRLQSEEDRKMTAYHEAGHAVVTYHLSKLDPVHRVSIVSRGLALGYTMVPPKVDRYNETQSRLLETITSMLGGRAAEEIIFNEYTVGASSDIEKATEIAREMVCRYGMSELGPVMLGKKDELVFLGRDFSEQKNYSEEMAAKIDGEINRIISQSYKNAKKILKDHQVKLDLAASELMRKETLEGDEFEELMKR